MAKICHKENVVTLTYCYECSSIVGGDFDGCMLWVTIDELGDIGHWWLHFMGYYWWIGGWYWSSETFIHNCLICLSFSFDVLILDHNFLVSWRNRNLSLSPCPAPPLISCKSTKRYSVVQTGVGPDSLGEGGMGEEWVEERLLNACPQQALRFKKTLL